MINDPSGAFAAAGILGLLLSLAFMALGLLIFWAIIRSAVKSGLRAHHEWLKTQPPHSR